MERVATMITGHFEVGIRVARVGRTNGCGAGNKIMCKDILFSAAALVG
jgi:hypothetical protein